MALQTLQSSWVTFRKILSHFPEELSLAFVYGSGVYRQAGPSSDQKSYLTAASRTCWLPYPQSTFLQHGSLPFPVLPPVLPASLFNSRVLQDSDLSSLGEFLPPVPLI
ncbi:TAMM41 isoform 12 [Pan troglodytes]|uniref:Chromosome 3 open reading frame 31, isoform CRA_e n=4 Tax=Homininae TaxID=207598 RepID=G3V0F3_HUMAN|nr:chromosome 3 open reading frame 31, isoform CRA_e [Homo sapiens]PNI53342.1 TAMM41 isoform 10 [Pan troglodytes]KAI2528293.1 TAM41 mitochondrial translocator assembly and maintenance-like protein [Homo sapiens]KAI2528294.1 TAM41 mitochondrial translocator assembly and maintenance-like protein [Homo sapiens]KAI4028358.1 TAM41 mitochondrial translocator assembly and maintenance homolog [Homo sapiens]